MNDVIIVSYDNSDKDMPAITCMRKNNDDIEMLVGYVGNEADELYRIVTQQRYLKQRFEDVHAKGFIEVLQVENEALKRLRSRCVPGAEELWDKGKIGLLKIVPNYENGVKPIKRHCNVTGVVGWYCGACDIMNVSEKPSYCRRCGTKIDWSDNNE